MLMKSLKSKYDIWIPTWTINGFFLKKHTDWGYENEYRITIGRMNLSRLYKKFGREDLEGIIFGLNAKPEKIKEIYEVNRRSLSTQKA